MGDKLYICECGKEFTNSQSFNGHKAHCKIHLTKTGKLNRREQLQKEFASIGSKASVKANKDRKQQKLEKWVAEKHRCETCGKIMTEYYGSGRFCSRSCSNSRNHDQETKKKTSESLKDYYSNNDISIHDKYEKQYNLNPKYCVICGKKLSINKNT